MVDGRCHLVVVRLLFCSVSIVVNGIWSYSAVNTLRINLVSLFCCVAKYLKMAQWPNFFFDGKTCSVDIDSGDPFLFDASTKVKEIEVNVRNKRKGLVVYKVYPIYPITFFKRMVMVKQEVPVQYCDLIYNGHLLAFEDEETLEDYGIVYNKATIHMIINAEIFPPDYIKLRIKKLPGVSVLYDKVPPGFTVRALKKMVQKTEGSTVEEQLLVYGEVDLRDEKTLNIYGIANNSLFHLGIIRRLG